MNRRTTVFVVLLIIVVAGGGLAVALSGNKTAANSCKASGTPVAYKVTIQDGKVSDDHVSGKRCDTITFMNKDSTAREVAFGPHEHHMPYDGVAERVLSKNQSLTITLDQTGSFQWHDHLHDEVVGYFTVKN